MPNRDDETCVKCKKRVAIEDGLFHKDKNEFHFIECAAKIDPAIADLLPPPYLTEAKVALAAIEVDNEDGHKLRVSYLIAFCKAMIKWAIHIERKLEDI